jgi:hypothetical protein
MGRKTQNGTKQQNGAKKERIKIDTRELQKVEVLDDLAALGLSPTAVKRFGRRIKEFAVSGERRTERVPKSQQEIMQFPEFSITVRFRYGGREGVAMVYSKGGKYAYIGPPAEPKENSSQTKADYEAMYAEGFMVPVRHPGKHKSQ